VIRCASRLVLLHSTLHLATVRSSSLRIAPHRIGCDTPGSSLVHALRHDSTRGWYHDLLALLGRASSSPVFSNIAPSGHLDALALADVSSLISSVHEYYVDYFVVTPSLFHCDVTLLSAQRAIKINPSYASVDAYANDRDYQGLLALMLSLKKRPDIRFLSGSAKAKALATNLSATMRRDESELFTFASGEPTLLLLLDRKEDVVTPLLTQWTYQAMVHELLGIEMNRVHIGDSAPAPAEKEKEKESMKDVILSVESDAFFSSSCRVHFGELGVRVKALVAEFHALTKTQSKLESIEDMQRFVDNYPQFKHASLLMGKHVSVMGEISRLVNTRKLLLVSKVEQTIVCGTEHIEAVKLIEEVMEGEAVSARTERRGAQGAWQQQ
jgi:vacuolar protein sorting-associated protein 45